MLTFKKSIFFGVRKKSVLFCLVLVLTSCYTPKNTTLLQQSKTLPTYSEAEYQHYKIAPLDEIVFRMLSTDENFTNLIGVNKITSGVASVTYRVYPDSTVDLPYLQSIKIGGLTLAEASNVISKKYKDIVPDAEVKLTLANKSYTVIGEAGTGVFPIYKERLTIYQALAQSGEIQLGGDKKHVKIIRQSASNYEVLDFDIRPQSVINSKYYYIYPNDIIYIQKTSSSFYKVNNYTSFLGLITSSISLLMSAIYFNQVK